MPAKLKKHVELQPRDFALFRGLFEARLMKLSHIAKLYFDGSEDAAKKRIQGLKQANYLKERAGRRPYEPAIIGLTRPAFEAARAEGTLDDYPRIGWKSLEKRFDVKPLTLAHELRVVDVKAALTPAITARPNLTITEFTVWPHLCEFMVSRAGERRLVKPDGLLRIQDNEDEGSELVFFLEVDRGQETHEVLLNKALDYLAYSKTDDLAKFLGVTGRVGFRTLVVFRTPTQRNDVPSTERRNNMLEKVLLLPERIGGLIWTTTLEEVLSDPLGDIWVTPKAYYDVTRMTDFDPEHRRHYKGAYKRRPQRERLVEEHVKKISLLSM